MKQRIEFINENVPDYVQNFIKVWKEKKHYSDDPTLTLGECIELVIATTHTLYSEDSDGRFFNHSLQNEESVIEWEGDSLIDILFYEAVSLIKRRIGIAGTFNEELDNSPEK